MFLSNVLVYVLACSVCFLACFMLIFALVVIVEILYGSCQAKNFLFSENDSGYKVEIPNSFFPKLIVLGIDVKIVKYCSRRKIHEIHLIFLSSYLSSWLLLIGYSIISKDILMTFQ